MIREANQRAVALLGTDRRSVAGRQLASFVAPGDRSRLRDQLGRLAREDTADWTLALDPGGHGPVPAAVSVAVGRGGGGGWWAPTAPG